jgi:hypothetical protein
VKVLLVDGPKAGVVYEVPDGFRSIVMPVFGTPALVERFNPGRSVIWDEPFSQVVYAFHRCLVFGHHMTLGSVNSGAPRDCDLFRLLTSDLAKAAVNV